MGGGKRYNMTQEEKVGKWIEENYEWVRGQINTNIAKNQMAQYREDLIQEMMLSLYNMKPEKFDQMVRDEKLRWWVLTGAGMALRSSTSPFYLKIRKHKMFAREMGLPNSNKNIFETGEHYEIYEEVYYQCYREEMKNLHWYNRKLVDEYWFQGKTIQSLHEKYNISKVHITRDLNVAILQIRENCKNCDS